MDADMQAAFEAFMMGGSKSSEPPPSPKKESRDENYGIRRKKGYRPILKAYQGRIEEWKNTVRQLEGVLGSISNLRDRVYWENASLELFEKDDNEGRTVGQFMGERARQPPWREFGFRSGHSGGGNALLLKEDVRSALHHDLLQHERMLSALRSLLASLAHTVDDIGRRLDEWMMQELTDPGNYDDDDDDDGMMMADDEKAFVARLNEAKAFQLAQDVYSLLASDLYRKQKMAVQIFESCHDGVLERGRATELSNDALWKPDPRDVSKKASKECSRTGAAALTWEAVDRLMSIS
mmetsp:Transcript_4011/g.11443  ORF Transcript_4011/g.11443 Transcript_4011/m.11443 type:complete len:294 (-) Transcript_4011:3538-4419(-)